MFTKRAEDCAQPQSPGSFASGSIDRISKFAVELEQRVRSLEHAEELKEQLGSEHFTDLLEEGIRQAARSLSDERRRYIASLIVSGLSAENIAHAESRHLLRTLDEINDVEVIWLNVHQETIVGDDEVFWKKHESVLQPAVAALGSSTQELDKHTLQESYKEHLCQLGLLERRYQMNLRTRQPEFDRNGKQKIQGYEITSFGALLLRHIGLGEA